LRVNSGTGKQKTAEGGLCCASLLTEQEAVMVAASFAVRTGEGVQINAPSDAKMRGAERVVPWPKEWSAVLK
jgi:hypothetical protein